MDRDDDLEGLQREVESLRRALESRTTTGMAVGYLAGTGRWSSREAWLRLRRMSQSHNVKVKLLAGRIVSLTEEAGSDQQVLGWLDRESGLPAPCALDDGSRGSAAAGAVPPI